VLGYGCKQNKQGAGQVSEVINISDGATKEGSRKMHRRRSSIRASTKTSERGATGAD
jgi:hypothetical protein